jgi:hypothetical protein
MRRSRILTAVAAMTFASAAALIPATAAHAASGLGWSASWSYYLDNNHTFNVTLPGVQVVGFGGDSGERRVVGASLVDTAVDGRCARVGIFDEAFNNVAARMVCDGQPYVTFSFSVFGAYQVGLRQENPTTGEVKGIFLDVPTSAADPELRRAGTGASWSFYTDRDYQFELRRPGAHLVGFGSRSVAVASVEHTGAAGTCVEGRVADLDTGAMDSGRTCNPGGFDTLAVSSTGRGIHTDVCVEPAFRCVDIGVPEPF